MTGRLPLLALLLPGLAGCRETTTGDPRPLRAPGGPRVESFSESSSVTRLTPATPYVFAGTTHGLDRFDPRTGEGVHFGLAEGLPGERVVDVAAADAQRVWVLTEAGLTRFDAGAGSFTPITPPASHHGVFADLALDPVGGVWVAGPGGLFRAEQAEGELWGAGYAKPVTALLAARSGDLWMGVKDGVAVRKKNGTVEELGAGQGLVVASVDWIVEWPDGALLVVGKSADGHTRLAVKVGDAFVTYRASPEPRIVDVTARGGDILLLTAQRLYALGPPQAGADVLRRAGMHLVPLTKGARSPYEVRLVDVALPRGASALAAHEGELLVGTVGIGTERAPLRRGAPPSWLRRRDLIKDAVDLTVACVKETCWVATGTSRAWRYDGIAFAPFILETDDGGVEPVVLAFVRAPDGAVMALYQDETKQLLKVARLDDKGVFVPLRDLAVETPSSLAGLTFAKFSPDGFLWVGLQIRDEEGEARPFGVASISPSLGAVMYHREEVGDADRLRGILPVPRNVTDVAFVSDDELWFATINGAARMVGKDITVFTEAEGLESEILHGVVATDGGVVFVASSRGVGEFDGTRWTWPRALRVSANALARGADGRLWMGTDHGLLAYDGRRIARVDRKRGLLDDEVYDVAVDHLGRLWVRGAQGVSVVDP